MKNAIAYIKVLKEKHSKPDLGLDQVAAIHSFALRESFEIFETFTEKQSGDADERSKLYAAIKAAHDAKVPIIVAKLDQLSHDMNVVAGLMGEAIFIVADRGGVS